MPLSYTAEEQANIDASLAPGGAGWDDDRVSTIRAKIKDYYIKGHFFQCCYCGSVFNGVHRMNIDVEHILPKSKFPEITFEEQNVNVACKKCNLTSKGQKIDFIVDAAAMGNDYFKSKHYKFIHPNLDVYTDYITIITSRSGDNYLHKYIIKPGGKGQYTYTYFHLDEFEIENINKAQGIKGISIFSEQISTFLRQKLIVLISKI